MNHKQKLLLLTNTFPYPPRESGGKLLCSKFIEFFGIDYDIYLISFIEKENYPHIFELSKICKESYFVNILNYTSTKKFFSLLSLTPSSVGKFRNKEMKKKVTEWISIYDFHLIFSFGIGMETYIKNHRTPTIVAPVDAMSLLFKRRSKYTSQLHKKIIFTWESWRLKRYELRVLPRYSACLLVSESDHNYYTSIGIHNSFFATNGVDANYFRPSNKPEKNSIVFTGVMNYPPNIDAVQYMVCDVMPILIKENPELKFYIVGRDPPIEVCQLSSNNIEITGFVPDIKSYIARSTVYVSPLRYGTGIKNKILEAASMGKPIVASSISLEGLKYLEPYVKVANTPFEIALMVKQILEDKKLANMIGSQLRITVEKNYSWKNTFEIIRNKINEILDEKSAKSFN